MLSMNTLFAPAVALTLLAAVYYRHRKKPVGIAGWLIPIASGLIVALVSGGFELSIDLQLATIENRHRVGAMKLERSVAHLLAGIHAVVAVSVIGLWLLPRKEDEAAMPWKALVGITTLSAVALVIAYTVGQGRLSGSAYAFANGFFVVIVASHAALMRLSNSKTPWERALTGILLAATAVAGWAAAMYLPVIWHWSTLSMATLENLMRRAYVDLQLESAWPWVAAPAFAVLTLSLLQFLLRGRDRFTPNSPGMPRRAAFATALVAVLAVSSTWFARQYDSLVDKTMDLRERYMKPLSFLEDVDLPQSTSRLLVEQTPLIKLGQDTTVVAIDLALRGTVDFDATAEPKTSPPPRSVDSDEELRSAIEDVLNAKKREDNILGKPFDRLITVAADRCLPVTRVVDALTDAGASGFYKFKLATRKEGAEGVINTTAPARHDAAFEDGDLQFHYKFQLTESGVILFIDGKPVPAVAGCPEDGPTLCIESPATEHDCAPTYAWERLRRLVSDAHAETPDETVFLVIPGDEIPWQTAVELADAVRLRDPEGRWESDNELLLDLVFYGGTAPPPHDTLRRPD